MLTSSYSFIRSMCSLEHIVSNVEFFHEEKENRNNRNKRNISLIWVTLTLLHLWSNAFYKYPPSAITFLHNCFYEKFNCTKFQLNSYLHHDILDLWGYAISSNHDTHFHTTSFDINRICICISLYAPNLNKRNIAFSTTMKKYIFWFLCYGNDKYIQKGNKKKIANTMWISLKMVPVYRKFSSSSSFFYFIFLNLMLYFA